MVISLKVEPTPFFFPLLPFDCFECCKALWMAVLGIREPGAVIGDLYGTQLAFILENTESASTLVPYDAGVSGRDVR